MNGPAIRRVLLDLVGTARSPDLGALGAGDWTQLDRLAGLHRLQPLLHARHSANPAIPAEIIAGWQAAKRLAAMTALAQQADLALTVKCLEAAGFSPVALKGAWLAAHAYPSPALRPMRDIDLLVPPQQVLDAFRQLEASGFQLAEDSALPIETHLRISKHMPQLAAPGGSIIELHMRMWEPHGQLDHASPADDLTGLIARARRGSDGVLYPAAQDMLGHLVVHAVYSHRLDCGPLLLHDIAHTVRVGMIDWPAFWASANRQGWRGGARLVLELVQNQIPEAAIDLSADDGLPCPPGLTEAAPDLLLQDLETRASARVAAAAIKRGHRALIQRLRRQADPVNAADARIAVRDRGGWLGWALSRGRRTLRELGQADTRLQSRQLAQLSTWLDR